MKKLVSPNTEKDILKTHPIISETKGWFIKVEETSNKAFIVEAIDHYGRIASKRGSDPELLQIEIEKLIKTICE